MPVQSFSITTNINNNQSIQTQLNRWIVAMAAHKQPNNKFHSRAGSNLGIYALLLWLNNPTLTTYSSHGISTPQNAPNGLCSGARTKLQER